ncbi:MAG: hypothetical protein FJ087_07450 [Deltaproteobacteria bacterium]|nr:hypothetical protein [Deltaproteobacteria bacterium]
MYPPGVTGIVRLLLGDPRTGPVPVLAAHPDDVTTPGRARARTASGAP